MFFPDGVIMEKTKTGVTPMIIYTIENMKLDMERALYGAMTA